MTVKLLFVGLLFLVSHNSRSQQILTLAKCQEMAYVNYPLNKQKLYQDDIQTLQLKNTSGIYNPHIALEAQSTWQNEVTGLNISLPGMSIEPLDKLQYKSQIVFNQIIYSGGKRALQSKLLKTNNTIEKLKLELDLYALRFIINKAYFTALMMQENMESLNSMKLTLLANKNDVVAGITNGILTNDKLAAIEVEIITVEQGISSLAAQKLSALTTLSLYTGIEITSTDSLKIPNNDLAVKRPEYNLFNEQRLLLELSNSLIDASRKPFVTGFGQLGYGKPGFNMLKNEMSEFYLVGAKLSWNITDWNTSKRDKKINQLKQVTIDVQKEVFDLKLNDLIQQQQNYLAYLDDVLSSDVKMVESRYAIAKVSERQLNLGEIRTSEYIKDLQNAVSAEIKYKQHQIEKSMTLIAIKTIRGEAN